MIPSLFTRFYYSKFFSIAVLLFLSMYNVSHAVTYASDGIVGNTYYYTSQIGV